MGAVLDEFVASLKRGLRLLFFQKIPQAGLPVGAGAIVLMVLATLGATALLDIYLAGPNVTFNPFGLSAFIAQIALFWLFLLLLGSGPNTPPISKVLSDSYALTLFTFAAFVPFLIAETYSTDTGFSLGSVLFYVMSGFMVIWGFAAFWRAGHVFWRGQLRMPGLRLFATALIPFVLIPMQPTFYGSETDWTRFDIWELAKKGGKYFAKTDEQKVARKPKPVINIEAVFDIQRDLVDQALKRLKPSPKDRPQIYFLGAGSYAGQEVFKREVRGAKVIFDSRLGTHGRSLLLINNPATIKTVPLANTVNLRRSLLGLAKIMDLEKDILALFITSHGSQNKLAVTFPQVKLRHFTPKLLKAELDAAGIKHRVIIISACHSGSFIPYLANTNTLILTASHAEKTSFGCDNSRNWTYFGDALFNIALKSTRSLQEGFKTAKNIIEKWEKDQKLPPSDPQISRGTTIVKSLKRVISQLNKEDPMASSLAQRNAQANFPINDLPVALPVTASMQNPTP